MESCPKLVRLPNINLKSGWTNSVREQMNLQRVTAAFYSQHNIDVGYSLTKKTKDK